MEKDLKMEVFASVDTVKPVEFHVYELHVQKIENTYSIIRGAAWKLRNWNQAGVFEDGNKIYATEKLQEKIPNADFTVEYEGSRELPVLENRRIYQELIKYWITQKLSQTSVYKGYKQDKIEMRGDRAEMSDFPLYLNTVAGGLDRRDQTIGGFSFVVKIYAVPVVEII